MISARRLLLVLALPICFCLSPAQGQQYSAQSAKPPSTPSKPLREPVELADLPKFSGHAKFDYGYVKTTAGGEGTVLHYRIKESPQQVMEWYENVLSMGQWNIQGKSAHTITAQKNENRCEIDVATVLNREYPTSLNISYFVNNPN